MASCANTLGTSTEAGTRHTSSPEGHEGSQSSDVDLTEVMILQKGDKHSYTVPSFPVVTTMLREVKLSFGGPDGREVFDGYMRECDLLNHDLPAIAQIESGYSHAFIIKVAINLG